MRVCQTIIGTFLIDFECGKAMAQSMLEETLPNIVVIPDPFTTCEKCYASVAKKDLEGHLEQECPKNFVVCSYCHESYLCCNSHNCIIVHYCYICYKPIDKCTCEGTVVIGNNRSGNGRGNNNGRDTGGVPFGRSWGSSSNSSWTSTIYSPNNGETLIPNYKIPTEWRGQFPNIYACFLCCMEYIWNIQHNTPDYRNSIHINGTEKYTEWLRGYYEFDYKSIFNVPSFQGVGSLDAIELLAFEGFQFVEITKNEIQNYLDSQYLIIFSYRIDITSGHAVLVIGYDNNNNLIVVDPATGAIRKIDSNCDNISVIAISPYTYNSRILNDFDNE